MKINVYFHCSDTYGEVYIFQQWDKILGVVDSNDAKWQSEYFNPIFAKAGIEITSPDVDEEYLEAVLRKWYGD